MPIRLREKTFMDFVVIIKINVTLVLCIHADHFHVYTKQTN